MEMKTETISRPDLVKKIAIFNVTSQQASEVLEKTLEEIGKALVDGKDVKIVSFGTFAVNHKKERPGRNPRTGKDAKVSARRVISFRACLDFKKTVAKLSA
jgi:integration host factor subunit alpha